MFFLGIMVGRGNSPVTFDTEQFHKRLERIVQEFGKTDDPEEKMDLQFYDALDKPILQEVTGKKNNPHEIIPKKAAGNVVTQVSVTSMIPVKTSRKAATLNKTALNNTQFKDKGSEDKGQLPGKKFRKVPFKKMIGKKSPEIEDFPEKTGESLAGVKLLPGMYTIQIAAYKSFADAVTQMIILEKKGFVSYRTLGKKDGVTWYRVRVGSFKTRDAASLYIGKLKQAKIDGMIIKKE